MDTTDRGRAALRGILLWSLAAILQVFALRAGSAPASVGQAAAEIEAAAVSSRQWEQAARVVPEGPFAQNECLGCHRERDPELVSQWRDGPHGKEVQCTACHGDRHGALPTARLDAVCTGCHGGSVADSYATSKHGVLVRIGRPDWTRPLSRGNHRAPSCAYCHLHDRDHADTMDPARGPAVREWVCSACHAPRYVAEQLAAGDRLKAIARVKLREAEELAASHPKGATAVSGHLESIERHLTNVRLGAGHQSPDYQWWHGQPALDGDLIRLRNAVAQAIRQSVASSPALGRSEDVQPDFAETIAVHRQKSP